MTTRAKRCRTPGAASEFFFLVPCSAIMKKARREFAKSASIKKPKTKYAPKHKKNLNQCF